MIYWYPGGHAEEGKLGPAGRRPAGDPRPADPADAGPGARPRPHRRPRHRAALGRGPAGRARLALSRPAPAGGPRLDRVLLGHFREQPPRALLPPDPERPQAAHRADQPLGRPGARDRPRPAPGHGVDVGWSRFFRRRRWDAERARELQAHVEMETEDNLARGMSPEGARWAAERKLGDVLRIREEID